MVENFHYFAVDFKQFPVFLIVYRIVLGWLGHSTFTACFGAALGYDKVDYYGGTKELVRILTRTEAVTCILRKRIYQ